MTFNKKGLALNVSLSFIGIYLLSFIIYYLGNFIFPESAALMYIDLFFDKATFILLPAVSALITFIPAAFDEKLSTSLIRMIAPSAARMVYFLPYFYLFCIEGGLESSEALLFGFLFALGDAALAYLFSLIIFFTMKLITVKKSGGKPLSEIVAPKTVLNFSEPLSFSLICVSFASFIYFMISEIINTVSFILEYSSFKASEIIYTVFSYVYILFILILYYSVLSAVKNLIIKNRLSS